MRGDEPNEALARREGRNAIEPGDEALGDPAKRSGADVAAGAAQGFRLFECVQCAAAVVDALKKNGLDGTVLDVRALDAAGDPSLHSIYSDELGAVISENGFHRAVRIGDLVFDNIHPSGTPYQQWLNDLNAPFDFALEEDPF